MIWLNPTRFIGDYDSGVEPENVAMLAEQVHAQPPPPRVTSMRKRLRPTWTAVYAIANTRPRVLNASGAAAASTNAPSIDPMISSCIVGRLGSYLSLIPAIWFHTDHAASSSTAVQSYPAAARSCRAEKLLSSPTALSAGGGPSGRTGGTPKVG
jgi:hypothetical protein